MNNQEKEPISEYRKQNLELDRKFAEYIKKLNETETISYTDDDGYFVKRTPEGVVTRIPNVARTEPQSHS